MTAENSFYWISIAYLFVLIFSVAAGIRLWRLNDKWERGEENRLARRYANYYVLGFAAIGAFSSVVLFFLSQAIQRQSDIKVAEANRIANEARERAAKLELQVEKIRAPRTLTKDQRAELASICQPFAGTKFRVTINLDDDEAQNFMVHIINPLINSGWEMVNYIGPFRAELSNKNSYGQDLLNGIKIEIDEQYAEQTRPAAENIANFLNKYGFVTAIRVYSSQAYGGILPQERASIHLAIGRKTP